ncbi:MAG: TlpA family protein disulfide reductase [Desulfobaccales bacterium]
MKRRILLLALGTFLMALLALQGGLLAAEREPEVGYNAGNVPFSAPGSPEEAAYLGLSAPAPFTLKDIKADYVLAESFNTTCPHCLQQAPILNRLYELVQRDAQLKGKLKFISVAQGNDLNAAKMWKTFHKIPFPVVPDPESKLGKALNFTPYPVSVVLDRNGKVVWVHIGTFESADEALREIKKVVK